MKFKIFIKLLFLKSFWQTAYELIYIWYIKKYVKYYTHIDYLPLFNFAEIMKGKFEYLFVGKKRRVPRIFFAKIFEKMNYQFKVLDNSNARDLADLAEYEYLYVSASNKKDYYFNKNEYNTLAAAIKKKKSTPFDLNDFTDYIERTYNLAPGAIDAHEISTAKAFGNYQKAIVKNRDSKMKKVS